MIIIYLLININFFPQEVCRKLLDFGFSYIKFSQLDRNIYLFIETDGLGFYKVFTIKQLI